MKKTLGILILFVCVCAVAGMLSDVFFSERNLQGLLLRVGLYGILAIGVSFVIVTGGIDLSIGSVVCLVGCGLPWLLTAHDWSPAAAIGVLALVVLGIGLAHGLLITKLGLQPFVITLCGLLVYRGVMRGLLNDQGQGFGNDYRGMRELATGEVPLAGLCLLVGALGLLVVTVLHLTRWRKGNAVRWIDGLTAAALVGLLVIGLAAPDFTVRMPFLIMLGVALLAAVFFNFTVWGRHLVALGNNEQAARFSGIATDRLVIMSYVVCALLSGLGGMLFVMDVNSAQPSDFGSFYELYAIAAAVIGGCSLRGGQAAVAGVVIGTALMQVLRNLIVLVFPQYQNVEFAVIGLVILLGVAGDVVFKRWWGRRRTA